jgi:hypothetical protein
MKSLSSSSHQQWLPTTGVTGKLFVTGATIGPIIDGIHNQCLLKYNIAPITIDIPNWISIFNDNNGNIIDKSSSSSSLLYYEPHLFASSWLVPPLLGIAYIILGGVLPRVVQNIVTMVETTMFTNETKTTKPISTLTLGFKAILAVITTAMIVQFSQYLILHPNENSYGIIDNSVIFESSETIEQHLLMLITAAITQWAYLDGTLPSLLTASIVSILGPLSELPFIANSIWEYLPAAGDIYVPFQNIEASSVLGQVVQRMFGDQYSTLALNGVTGPCYFAVTMDAIAIGRFFESIDRSSTTRRTKNDNQMDDNTMSTNRLFIASSQQQQQPVPGIATSNTAKTTADTATTRKDSQLQLSSPTNDDAIDLDDMTS